MERKSAGMPAPSFEHVQGFRVTFRKPTPSRKAHQSREEAAAVGDKTREKILRVLQGKPTITTAELAGSIGLSQKAIEWNIKKLRGEGLLQRVGPDKGARWEVAGER